MTGKVLEPTCSAVLQGLSMNGKARVAWLTYFDKKHSPPTDEGHIFSIERRQVTALSKFHPASAWVTRWCSMGSWFSIGVCSQHQDGLELSASTVLPADVMHVHSKPSLSQWFTVLISLGLVSLLRSLYLLMLWNDLTWGHVNQLSLFLLSPTQDVLEITAEWSYLWKPDFFLWQLWKVEIFNPNIYFLMKWSILSRSPKGAGENEDLSNEQ